MKENGELDKYYRNGQSDCAAATTPHGIINSEINNREGKLRKVGRQWEASDAIKSFKTESGKLIFKSTPKLNCDCEGVIKLIYERKKDIYSLEVFAGNFDGGLQDQISDGLGALIGTSHQQPHPRIGDYLGEDGAHNGGPAGGRENRWIKNSFCNFVNFEDKTFCRGVSVTELLKR